MAEPWMTSLDDVQLAGKLVWNIQEFLIYLAGTLVGGLERWFSRDCGLEGAHGTSSKEDSGQPKF